MFEHRDTMIVPSENFDDSPSFSNVHKHRNEIWILVRAAVIRIESDCQYNLHDI
jgi:hypothetical protein